jgi:hypothetical protein
MERSCAMKSDWIIKRGRNFQGLAGIENYSRKQFCVLRWPADARNFVLYGIGMDLWLRSVSTAFGGGLRKVTFYSQGWLAPAA